MEESILRGPLTILTYSTCGGVHTLEPICILQYINILHVEESTLSRPCIFYMWRSPHSVAPKLEHCPLSTLTFPAVGPIIIIYAAVAWLSGSMPWEEGWRGTGATTFPVLNPPLPPHDETIWCGRGGGGGEGMKEGGEVQLHTKAFTQQYRFKVMRPLCSYYTACLKVSLGVCTV